MRAVSFLRTFSTPIPWHDLIHTLLGTKSLLWVALNTEKDRKGTEKDRKGRTSLLFTEKEAEKKQPSGQYLGKVV